MDEHLHLVDPESTPAAAIDSPVEAAVASGNPTPTRRFELHDGAGRRVATASIWSTGIAPCGGVRTGAIGHFACEGEATGRAILDASVETLRKLGCDSVIAPFDGSTWHRYRLVTQVGTEPPFFLEPFLPLDTGPLFERAGFAVVAHYTSGLVSDLATVDPRALRAEQRFTAAGGVIRSLRVADFDAELRRIYELSLEAFAGNFLYTPIDGEDFAAMYERIRPFVQPQFVLLAELEGRLLAYVFAVPDLAQAQRGAAVDTLIVKTVAALPERAAAGLGAVLVDRVQRNARAAGLRRAIHALMHESNRSRNISRRYGETMRRYALYGRTLTDALP